jgi:uncharacterized membrane protein YcjF (UPF0283 family)
MNQRYAGEGPGGQTRKSAARAKPVTNAASSVHVKKKPQTDSEKRAARKQREKEAQDKAIIKNRKAKAKEEALAAEKGIDVVEEAAKPKAKEPGLIERLRTPATNMPTSDAYKLWRKRYWILIGIGIGAIALSLVAQLVFYSIQFFWMGSLAIAYMAIIAAFVIDFRKVRPMIKAHQRGSGNKSPKQLKHEEEAKERAAAIEAARKAAKQAKKSPLRKKKDTIVPGDE